MVGAIYTTKDENAKRARIEELIAKNAKYTLDDFGGKPSVMVSKYAKPIHYPRAERPRVFLTGDMIPKIKAALSDPEYSELAKLFWESANTSHYTHTVLTGIPEHNAPELPLPKEYLEGGPHEFDGSFLSLDITGTSYNWDGKVLALIEAKALAYLLTGDELYGREAILYVKNAMKTLRFTIELFCDPFRAFSYNMLVAAEVYDWCHDLLTEDDKEQLVSGCEHLLCLWDPKNGIHNMEIGFPPERGSGVSGHCVSIMLMRDYLAMAASIYEDHPDWWEFCAGRFYQEFVEPANVAFQGGLASQGTAIYGFNKFHTYLSCEWVMRNATGFDPFSPNMSKVMSSILGHMLPNGLMFPTGDGGRDDKGAYRLSAYSCMAFSSGLFPDPAVQANTKYFSNNYTRTDYFVNEVSESMMLILCSNAARPAKDRFSAIPMVHYNPFPFGQMTAHNSWDENGAASFMKIGEFTSANHDQRDSGTFQLYYKSLLLTSSGVYNYYGNNHHVFYHQQTVAQNGLLIFNPALHDPNADPEGDYGERCKFWYTGGQRSIGEPGTMERWYDGTYDLGRVTGYASDYLDGRSVPTYAYIAGDITKAYDTQNTVDHVERRMLTAYTDDKKCPMLFFTYDKVSGKKPEFKKTYLLHPTAEPEVNGNTITFSKNGARLVFNAIKGASRIEKIGGEGRAFEINGKNCLAKHLGTGNIAPENVELIWGRVEISDDTHKDHEFFNAMYVTDDDNTLIDVPVSYESDTVLAASTLGVCAAFIRSSERTADPIDFVGAEGTRRYYVSGVAAGDWRVSVDGAEVCVATADENGGFLSFDAKGGHVRIEKI